MLLNSGSPATSWTVPLLHHAAGWGQRIKNFEVLLLLSTCFPGQFCFNQPVPFSHPSPTRTLCSSLHLQKFPCPAGGNPCNPFFLLLAHLCQEYHTDISKHFSAWKLCPALSCPSLSSHPASHSIGAQDPPLCWDEISHFYTFCTLKHLRGISQCKWKENWPCDSTSHYSTRELSATKSNKLKVGILRSCHAASHDTSTMWWYLHTNS